MTLSRSPSSWVKSINVPSGVTLLFKASLSMAAVTSELILLVGDVLCCAGVLSVLCCCLFAPHAKFKERTAFTQLLLPQVNAEGLSTEHTIIIHMNQQQYRRSSTGGLSSPSRSSVVMRMSNHSNNNNNSNHTLVKSRSNKLHEEQFKVTLIKQQAKIFF